MKFPFLSSISRRIGIKRLLILLSIFIIIIFPALTPFFCYSETKHSIDADFILSTGTDVISEGLFDIEVDVEFKFKMSDKLDAFLELETDLYEVESEDISLRWKPLNYLWLKIGAFENNLVLDEYLSSFERLFAEDGLITETVGNIGYMSTTPSVKLYKNFNNKKQDAPPFSYLFTIKQQPNANYLQGDFGFIYHFQGENSYIGVLGSYSPHYQNSTIERKNSTRSPAYLADLFLANHETKLKYGIEVTLGANVVSPVSVVSHPAGFDDSSHFLGFDLQLGYSMSFKKLTWTPAVRTSLLFPELERVKARQLDVIVGNRIQFSKNIKINLDAGVSTISDYLGESTEEGIEAIVEIRFEVRT
jgi:hypothetical protein